MNEWRHGASNKLKRMKKLLPPIIVGLCVLAILTGCHISYTGGTKSSGEGPTVGQQLLDLQKAKDAGVITDAEYQQQKAKILGSTPTNSPSKK
jgi:hypothetical protein